MEAWHLFIVSMALQGCCPNDSINNDKCAFRSNMNCRSWGGREEGRLLCCKNPAGCLSSFEGWGVGVLLCDKLLVKTLFHKEPEATVLRSCIPPSHSNSTPQPPQLLPYHCMYTLHKAKNQYLWYFYTHAQTDSIKSDKEVEMPLCESA